MTDLLSLPWLEASVLVPLLVSGLVAKQVAPLLLGPPPTKLRTRFAALLGASTLSGIVPEYAFKPHGGLTGTMFYWKRLQTIAPA